MNAQLPECWYVRSIERPPKGASPFFCSSPNCVAIDARFGGERLFGARALLALICGSPARRGSRPNVSLAAPPATVGAAHERLPSLRRFPRGTRPMSASKGVMHESGALQ